MNNFQTLLLYLCMNYADSKTLLTRNVENVSVERHPILVILLFKDDCNIKSVYFKTIQIENISNRQ